MTTVAIHHSLCAVSIIAGQRPHQSLEPARRAHRQCLRSTAGGLWMSAPRRTRLRPGAAVPAPSGNVCHAKIGWKVARERLEEDGLLLMRLALFGLAPRV